jgi:hypothetical protein
LRPLHALPRSEGVTVLLRRATVPPAERAVAPFDGDSFSFLNQRLQWEGADRWHPAGADDLWVYNLHYFQYLPHLSPAPALDLIRDWISTNTNPRTFAWHAYPISLRVREWIEWLQANADLDPSLRQAVVNSIAQQTEALHHQLEFHLMGNHLLENAITLCWSGLSLEGPRADAWLAEGTDLLRQEVGQQVQADGTHDERSPMYQALLVEGMLRLSEVAARSSRREAAVVGDIAGTAGRRLLESLACLVHPDGRYALLNDTALDVPPPLESLQRRFGRHADRSEAAVWSLESAGYFGCRSGPDRYLVFDAGPIGPDHQPGHGHADTLSFELSHRGRRLVTDTGVYSYAAGLERRYDRSTAAHNTIACDGRDQSELWGAFRCARRPTVHIAQAKATPDGATLVGGYRGPGNGPGQVGHTRQIHATGRALMFTDSVTGAGEHRAVLRLHFAPGMSLRRSDRGWTVNDGRSLSLAHVGSEGLEWTASTSPYHPEFHLEVERPCLSATFAFRDRRTLKWRLSLG